MRFLIKFNGFFIAIVSLILAFFLMAWASTTTKVNWEKSLGIVFGILWIITSIFLLIALATEDKTLLCPFCTFYSIVVLLYVFVPLVMTFVDPWYLVYLLSPLFVIVCSYIALSMAALVRLFDKVNSSSESEPALV